MRVSRIWMGMAFLIACDGGSGGDDNDTDRDGGGPLDTGHDTGLPEAPEGITGTIRANHFGWRPADVKVAVILGLENAAVELRRAADDSVAAGFVSGALETDEDSGDRYSTVDFSAHTEPGAYYLHLPATNESSYTFEIREGVYDIVGRAAVKSYYFQRCNHDRALPYASDAMVSFSGIGGQWVDGECHTDDRAAPAGPGSEDHGALDVHGGWHDAGDYQKTLWGRGVNELLFAYELNPGAWRDGDLLIPESGNGVPDILDEIRWELDFYVRMQREDGHFMTSVKGNGGDVASPPSLSDQSRVYFDCTAPSGDGWSGGGVTLETATGNGVLSLAHGAVVFGAAGQTALAEQYREAALGGWDWLNGRSLTGGENRIKAAAAAAVARLDPSVRSAVSFIEGYSWADWDGDLPWSVTPKGDALSTGAWHILLSPDTGAALKETVRQAVGEAVVDRAFQEAGIYGGMFGGPDNAWDWSWGSNRSSSMYGANLLIAARFGITGGSTEAEIVTQGERYYHYMCGLNPLNMVYLTNMAAYGGEHSSFQIFHSWFSFTGGDGDNGNAEYNGKPVGVDEPLYPYYPDDDQTSAYGPAPGLVPGGPNHAYGGQYEIPNREYPAYAYRDFSVSCDWDGGNCRAASWEITEPSNGYQGAFVLLASFMMSGSGK